MAAAVLRIDQLGCWSCMATDWMWCRRVVLFGLMIGRSRTNCSIQTTVLGDYPMWTDIASGRERTKREMAQCMGLTVSRARSEISRLESDPLQSSAYE